MYAASATPPPSPASAAPHPSPAAQAKQPAATDSTAAATANSTPPSTASPSSKPATTHQPAPTSPAKSPKAKPPAKHDAPSNATSPTSSTAASTPGPKPHQHSTLDIGESNASSAPSSTAGPTERSTPQAPNAPTPLTAGSGTTTIAEDTQHSATDRPSAEPTSLGPTTRSAQAVLQIVGVACDADQKGRAGLAGTTAYAIAAASISTAGTSPHSSSSL